MSLKYASFVLVALLPVNVIACDLGLVPIVEEGSLESTVQSIAQSQSYLQPSFTRINREPYPTDLSTTDLIDVYVSKNGAVDYWQVDPASTVAIEPLSQSSVIVRVVLDRDWTPKKLTFMIKGPPGYFPGNGDYYYAVTELDGSISLDDSGLPMAGQLRECAQCHAERSATDFLFGVPGELRGKPPSTPSLTASGDVHDGHFPGFDSPLE